MRIPESAINDVRLASDIVDVISAHVALKKRGKNYLGLCPFHQEKTPSFTVSAEKQMYHCFGCGVGGNVFTFVMEHDKVSFVEAVRTLAERAGITLPTEGGPPTELSENEVLYDLCRRAGLWFHEQMMNTVEGKLALEYFRHRGFSDATIRRFGLGYSPNSWDALIRYAEQEKSELPFLLKAGLVVKREDGTGYYDRFRGRAMFPILSPSGRTVAFGARQLREDDTLAKYINSPETPIYNKSRTLYGLFQSKEAMRDKGFAVLVEGYADLISVYQSGIENVVASSGTALTPEQIQLVARYARDIVLVYDADSAGSKATVRGVDLIIENGLEVRVAALPQGEDPDSFVKKNGGKALQVLLDSAVSFLDFKAKLFQEQGLLETPDGQTRAVRSIVETISRMKDELKRNFYIKHVAERYGIYETVLFRELERTLSRSSLRAERRLEPQVPARGAPVETQPGSQVPPFERDLVKLMLENGPDMVRFVLAQLDESGWEGFNDPRAKQVADLVGRYVEEGVEWTVNTVLDTIEDAALKRFVADLVFNKYEISGGWAEIDSLPEDIDPWEVAESCLLIVRRKMIDEEIALNQQRMKQASIKNEPVIEYLEKHQALLDRKRELDTGRAVIRRVPSSQS